MVGTRKKPEVILLKLWQVEVLQGQGKSIADAVRQIGVAAYAAPKIPMARVITRNLDILGIHGLQGHCYDAMLRMAQSGNHEPVQPVLDETNLGGVPEGLIK